MCPHPHFLQYNQLSLGPFLSSSLVSLNPQTLLELLCYLCLLKGFFKSPEVMPMSGGRREEEGGRGFSLLEGAGSRNVLVHGCLAWVECLWGCANCQE